MNKMKRYLSLALVTLLMCSAVLTGWSKPIDNKNTAPKKESSKTDVNNKLTWYLVDPVQEQDTDKLLIKANENLNDILDSSTIELKLFAYGDDYNQKVNTSLACSEAFFI